MVKMQKDVYSTFEGWERDAFKRLYATMTHPARETPTRFDHGAFQKWYWAYPIENRQGCTLRVRQLICTLLWQEVGAAAPDKGAYVPDKTPRAPKGGVKGEDGITRYPEAPRVNHSWGSSRSLPGALRHPPPTQKRNLIKLAAALAKRQR